MLRDITSSRIHHDIMIFDLFVTLQKMRCAHQYLFDKYDLAISKNKNDRIFKLGHLIARAKHCSKLVLTQNLKKMPIRHFAKKWTICFFFQSQHQRSCLFRLRLQHSQLQHRQHSSIRPRASRHWQFI